MQKLLTIMDDVNVTYEMTKNIYCPKCSNKKNWKETSAKLNPPIFTTFICPKCIYAFEIELGSQPQYFIPEIVKQLEKKSKNKNIKKLKHAIESVEV